MRTVLVVTLAFLPLIHAQNPNLIKAVEPNYEKYGPNLATEFDTASASVTLTIAGNGKPFALNISSVPLPMAVVMALKDYEFRRQTDVSHVHEPLEGSYKVTLNVPIRQSKARQVNPTPALVPTVIGEQPGANPVRIESGIARGLLRDQVQPVYPESARHNGIQGDIIFQAVISEQGAIKELRTRNGPFSLIEAAYEAVRQWQYRPYLLQGQPAEVATEIVVTFSSSLLLPL